MSDTKFQMTREEFEEMFAVFSKTKHDIYNVFSIIMALSELGQRNPAHLEKLAKTVLARSPEVIEKLQEFQNAMSAKLKAEPQM